MPHPHIRIGYLGIRPFMLLEAITATQPGIEFFIEPLSTDYHPPAPENLIFAIAAPSFPSAMVVFRELAFQFGRETLPTPVKWRDYRLVLDAYRKPQPRFIPPPPLKSHRPIPPRKTTRHREQRTRRRSHRLNVQARSSSPLKTEN